MIVLYKRGLVSPTHSRILRQKGHTMKKALFGILTLILILTMGLIVCSADEDKNVTCYIGGEIIVDGEIDDVWEEVDFIYVENLKTGQYKGDSSKTSEDYAELQCKVLWDGEYTLYILYVVYDPLICQDGREEWDRDSVEFFIDEDNERAGAFDGNSTQWRVQAIEQNDGYLNWKVPAQAVKMIPNGYVVEVAYEFMDVDPTDGHVIGFDLQLNDDAEGNGKRHACLGWSDIDDSASSNNTVWGTLTFSTERVKGAQGGGEGETETQPTVALEQNNIYNYWNEDIVAGCITSPNQTLVEYTEEGVKLTGMDGNPVDPYVTINLKKYVDSVGAESLSCTEYGYVVFKVKATGTNGECELFYTKSPAAGLSEVAYFDADGSWQYLVYDLSCYDDWAKERTPFSVRLDWATGYEGEAADASLTIGEIAFFKTEDEIYAYTGEAKPVETEAPTEAPTEPVTVPATEAPATEAPAETEAPKGGCGSVVGLSAAVILLTATAFGCALKKKED